LGRRATASARRVARRHDIDHLVIAQISGRAAVIESRRWMSVL
jgi:hypothetical protein